MDLAKLKNTTNIALMGCGRICKKHAEAIAAAPGIRLAGVCDPKIERANDFAARYDVGGYSSLAELLANEDVDAVSVLTPSGMHRDNALEVMEAGKHVLVEKPIALRPDQVVEMAATARERGLHAFVVKQNRFNKPVLQLRRAIDDGRLGRLVMGTVRVRWCRTEAYYQQDPWRGTWAQDGGVLANQAIHHLDLLQWFLGPVTSVFGFGRTALVDIEAEDTAVVTLNFKSGAVGVFEATNAARPVDTEGSVSVLGEGGLVEVGGFAANELKTWNFVDRTEADAGVVGDSATNPSDVYGFGHAEVYRHLQAALLGEAHSLVTAEQALDGIVLLHAIYESIETGRQVYVDDWKNFANVKLGREVL